ncbi:ndufb9, NADH-ubiquinone oxidoreductase [Cichlidogyrus casuarinus]|uniref:NADH dehydrogenase [ubiquinone] 1 beta subcomplex subunit 9 n=1 Tax=Cichlidogyrus casuarinus TaxID=1844966 RepID=A0ABD2QGP1_9PLAT
MSSLPKLPQHLRTKLIPHAQRVCQLYKLCLYDLKMKCNGVLDYRYKAVLMRQRFEQNRNIMDEVKAKKVLEEAWREYEAKKSPYNFHYPTSPGGACYERITPQLDFRVDMWHPTQKALYPDYFARREQRKKEFRERWAKKYGYASAEAAEEALSQPH